ncbi:hypothetical protein HYU19_03640 [Candidatus Woesearchaeota archaeon]|nr:hypothetical protein [Candidatus Woesearchaeota archaeon]
MKTYPYKNVMIIPQFYGGTRLPYDPTCPSTEGRWTISQFCKPMISRARVACRIDDSRLTVTIGTPTGTICTLALAYIYAQQKEEGIRTYWNWQGRPTEHVSHDPETKDDYACLALINADEWPAMDLAQLVPCVGEDKSVLENMVIQATVQDLEEITRIVKDNPQKRDRGYTVSV